MTQRLLGDIRRTDERFSLIPQNGRVAVGLSGGKDSLALLTLLNAYRQIKPFSLCALTLVPKGRMDISSLQALCGTLHVPLQTRESDLFDGIFERKNPCSLCARVRRGTLVCMAAESGCTHLALGHHLDDALETLVMSVTREGRFHTMTPKARMERGSITVIRPLILTRESALSAFCGNAGLKPVKNPCPVDGRTARREARIFLDKMRDGCPDLIEKLTSALLKADFFMPEEIHGGSIAGDY